MAAEFLLTFALEETMTRVIGSIAAEGKRFTSGGSKTQHRKLIESMTLLKAVLHDAEKRPATDEPVKLLLQRLQDVAYDAEDVLDDFHYEILRRKVESQNDDLKGKKVRNFISLIRVNPIAFRRNMSLKVEMINEKLDELKKDAAAFGLSFKSVEKPPQLGLGRETDSFLSNSEVIIGREDDVSKIVNLLTNYSTDEQLPISLIPIVGMPGFGKTTLAKMVCEEVKKEKLFDEIIWVCVSENFDDRTILGGMLQTLDKNTGCVNEINALIRHLQQLLEKKKFLLVLDDVWNEDRAKWESLKDRLLKISNHTGNAVVVTSRSGVVASMMETDPKCRNELEGLSDGECWSIIKQQVARVTGGAPIPSGLEAMGLEIAEKCRGVPLVARVLGGTMGSNLDEEKWMSIKNSTSVWDSLEDDNRALRILKLSFDHLSSPSIKRCFAYCALYPKDFDFKKEELIQLWAAEGLLGSANEKIEETGDRYFNYLLAHSFFQDVEKDEFENIIYCRMHDLVHDLALSVSKPETLLLASTGSNVDSTACIRHLNLISNEKIETTFRKVGARKLRSFFSRDDVLRESWKFKSLRTLKLNNNAYILELPASIGELKHLRYLDVSHTRIKLLPESITKLFHLQSLRFNRCSSLEKLPEKMRNLVNLRHLCFSNAGLVPAYVGCLTLLQTLPFFVVGPERGRTIEELGCLNELGGRLVIWNLENVREKAEAEKAKLRGKAKICELELIWNSMRDDESSSSSRSNNNIHDDYEGVLEGLQPHPNIRSLRMIMDGYMGGKLASWLSLLNHLVELRLKGCNQCEQLPTLGHLPRLKILLIEGMHGVKHIGGDFYNNNNSHGSSSGPVVLFPVLKEFVLEEMESLVEWRVPDVDNNVSIFPCLEELTVRDCPRLKSIPSVSHLPSSLEELEIWGCYELSELCGEFIHGAPLKSLSISCCPKLTSLSTRLLQNCTALEKLSINDCDLLTSVPALPELACLVYLCIERCPSLANSLKEDFFSCLTRLKTLQIGGFSKEPEAFPVEILDSIVQHLSRSLEKVTLVGWDKVKNLPDQLQSLTSLTELNIRCFNSIAEALPDWLGNLSSLKTLGIFRCENLKFLPSSTAMQHLSNLQQLEIFGCPLLQKNCSNKGELGIGLEWPKISHIRDIRIFQG